MRILIGSDGSLQSDLALQGLVLAGLPSESKALVATVTTPWPDIHPDFLAGSSFYDQATGIGAYAIKDAQKIADRAARKLGKLFPAWRVGAEAILSRPALGLLGKADSWNPDLIVLGSHGRTGIGKLVLGSVSLRILHHAKADVRISRSGYARGKARAVRILLGMDGSAGAERAFEVVKSRDWPKGSAVRVVAVADWRADCIFVGSRGLNAVDRFLIGSTSSAVAADAACSVEVVRKGGGLHPPTAK